MGGSQDEARQGVWNVIKSQKETDHLPYPCLIHTETLVIYKSSLLLYLQLPPPPRGLGER